VLETAKLNGLYPEAWLADVTDRMAGRSSDQSARRIASLELESRTCQTGGTTAEANEVLVVLDPNFGERLRHASGRQPVWIVMSPANEPVIRSIWAATTSISHLTGSPLLLTMKTKGRNVASSHTWTRLSFIMARCRQQHPTR
jgi:hypothetical protein